MEDEYDIDTEYTYTYRREYDSTFRSRYEASRNYNAAAYDTIGAADISNVIVLAPYSTAINLTRAVLFDVFLDNFVKLLSYPKDPKKIIYRKVSEQKKVTRSEYKHNYRGR